MDLRGVGKVVPIGEAEVGRFYRRHDYQGNTVLFQVIEEASPDGTRNWCLEFWPADGGGARLEELHSHIMVGEVANVHLRVDPASLGGDEFSTNRSAGMLLVSETVAFLLATPPRNYGYMAVDLFTGRIAQARLSGWAWFSRWSLVTDDGDEEIELVKYDRAERA